MSGSGGSWASRQAGGSVQIALQVGGASINTVNYTITGPASFTQNGTIDVSHSNTISALLGPFAAGGPYTITLTGTSTDGAETCAGSGTFTIAAGQTVSATVPLTCHQAPRTGSVSVNGAVNVCPEIDSLSADPTEVFVGGSVGLSATAHDADNGPSSLTASWTAPAGVFTEPSSLSTRFTCTAPGSATITLTVSDGDRTAGCPASSSVTIICDPRPAAATCQLGNGAGAIKHVIYLQFDNTHLNRDKPNIKSDLESMPHLLNFIRGNGTMMANDHTILISHTAGGILSSLTGVYPDRDGQTVSNSYVRTSATGAFSFPSSFEYWTDTAAAGVFNMVTPTGQNMPAPWVGYTRAGCDVGGVGTANIELETASASTFSDVATVFGTSSPEFAEAKASAAAASGSAARNLAQTDFVGIAVHCAQGSARCAGGVADLLPGEPGGYAGFNGLFGAKHVDPVLTGQDASVPLVSMLGNPIVDPFGQPGFPGFDGMEAEVSLRYVASMQEAGIPVTYAYISDAHDNHATELAMGPGQAEYEQQLATYDQAFANFFTELAQHGIDQTNTLFVVTVDEGDHFVGGTPTPAGCDGTPGNTCNWTGQIGEIDFNIDTAVQNQLPSLFNMFLASTGPDTFTVHGDDAPPFYLARKGAGPLAQTDPDTRTFERAIAGLTAANPLTGNTDLLLSQYADQTGMKALHMFTTGDLGRNGTFVFFGDPDYFITDFPTSTCATCVNPGFAWNHGDVQKEISQTWIGLVGPGVANQPDQAIFTDHTDLRPTINALTGLPDTYESDGRVMTQALVSGAVPAGVSAEQSTVEALGAAYKAINAPFGQFAQDMLATSTKALQGADLGDTIYTSKEGSVANLTAARDVLAAQIRTALDLAEFGSQPIDAVEAAGWVSQAQTLMTNADALASAP